MSKLRAILTFLVAAVLSFTIAYGLLTARTYQLTENVQATRLVQCCELWRFTPPAQKVRTIMVACPRQDLLRIWPLPVQQPWYEDPSTPGQIEAMR